MLRLKQGWQVSPSVTELKGFVAWGVPFKNETWLSTRWFCLFAASKGNEIHIQNSVSENGGLAIAYIYYLANYTLISSLQLATLTLFIFCGAFPVYIHICKILCYILTFSKNSI